MPREDVRAESECAENGCQIGYLGQITERAVTAEAHAENLAEALDELLIGGADAVSMEYAKRTAKVVLRSYRKARDAT